MNAPRSVFAQLALVIALVLAGAATLALLLGREFAARPATAQLLRNVDGLADAVEALARDGRRTQALQRLSAAGIELREDAPAAVRTRPLAVMRRFEARARAVLGPERDLRLGDGDAGNVLWLRLELSPPVWVALVHDRRGAGVRRFSALMLAGCVLLVWAAAAHFARRLVQPLRRLADAAPALVRGEDAVPALGPAPAEVVELARSLGEANREVREAAEERMVMLAGISHDLRTPLTRLQYALALVPDTDRELQAGMYRDIAEIDAILSQFIAYARDGRDENVELVDLVQVCRNALAAGEGEWAVDLPDSAPIHGRPMVLLRAVENLVVNAGRHGAPPLSLSLSRDGDAWCVEVADAGPGIPDEQVQRVQRPFVHGDRGGSGLGLAIVARVARQHHGELRLLSQAPRGLRAQMRLRGA
ncbi:ATP-binding protein [Luteimonas saliphila]|uniref:ATP-binding protein n=1 Tax=Luteimonas saliphila TaxID=2804919 RepID=UPI00192DE4CC|nr:ATP-binding protein [Luteimonas saliphila]